MLRKILCSGLWLVLLQYVGAAYAAPVVTGQPIIVQHLGKLQWPQDDDVTSPYLTQLVANDINDLHGDVSCELIISTPGNYHMALRDAMKGRADLGLIGLQEQARALGVNICWSTSPPIGPAQIAAEDLQFKNIHLRGRPALAMGPGAVMNNMIANGQVDAASRAAFMQNQGNVILLRAEMKESIHNICDLGKNKVRVVTPNPQLEPGSFGNFSETIYEVAAQNSFGCDATSLFNSIFSQDAAAIDTTAFSNPYAISKVLKVFKEGHGVKWVASSRIMHRDIPYALCHDEADAGVIFYHQAKYLKETLAATGCHLEILALGGTEAAPLPLHGNRVGKLFVAKVNGDFAPNVIQARDLVYDFLTSSPAWASILAEHGMLFPQ